MTSEVQSSQYDLAESARRMDLTLSNLTAALVEKIRLQGEKIRRIEDLVPMSEEKERQKYLAICHANLVAMTHQLQRTRRDAGFGGLGSPIQTLKGWRDVRRAQMELTQAEQAFEAPETGAERTTLINTHNQYVAAERGHLSELRQELKSHVATHSAVSRFHQNAAEAVSAAIGNGWLAPDFPDRFRAMAIQVETENITGATPHLSALVFQRQPPTATYDQWQKEANGIRDEAYQKYTGIAASGAYPEVIARSIELARDALRETPARTLASYAHATDQWQVLSALLADPRHFRTDALWAVYWSMLQCEQWVTNTFSEADAHEDVLSGKLTAQIDRWLSDWAGSRVRQFGYPEIQSYMGTLEIASTGEETRLGADIGLIVDLDIGGLVCRKVALFQAKKTKQGRANIGSDSGQLPKLAALPRMGFYLFYHQSQYPLRSPAPTICSAHTLADLVTKDNKSPGAGFLPVNVRTLGWDWASFVSFGMCQPASELGESFVTVDDALKILGGGDPRHLPKYLHVIAITDEPRVLALREKIHEHYIDSVKVMEKHHDRSRNKPREIDGHERGMHM